MDSNTKKSLADYMKEVEPYEKEETWVDDCRTLKDVARALVTLQKEIKEGKEIGDIFMISYKEAEKEAQKIAKITLLNYIN